MIGILRGSKTTRRVSGFQGSAASSGGIMRCLVVGRSFELDVSEVAAGMSGVSAAMRGPGKEASEYPRLLCGRQLAAKATPAPLPSASRSHALQHSGSYAAPSESLLSPNLGRHNTQQIRPLLRSTTWLLYDKHGRRADSHAANFCVRPPPITADPLSHVE